MMIYGSYGIQRLGNKPFRKGMIFIAIRKGNDYAKDIKGKLMPDWDCFYFVRANTVTEAADLVDQREPYCQIIHAIDSEPDESSPVIPVILMGPFYGVDSFSMSNATYTREDSAAPWKKVSVA